MQPKFTHLMQLGILVKDLEKAIKHYEEFLGFGPWKIIEFGPEMFPKMLVDGKPGMLEIRCAFCQCFGMEIELIQPVSDSVYKTWLEEHGPGLHHIAVRTKDQFGQVIRDVKERFGNKPWIHAKEDNGKDGEGMEFAYLDLAEEMGLYVEIYNEARTGGLPYETTER
ncbi:MAG: VOC family protein [Saccharofermentanales bacterium]|nr:methylmalonyl-CoA epimerase [Clostridiaceae bacterium]